ncbi:MAG TPA: ABC transporter permease [Vicinamibacteria bacterium]
MSAPFSPPSLLERTLVRIVGDTPTSEAALGDLREELAARARGGAAWRAWLWYAREAWSLAWAIGRERRRDAAWRSSALARRRRQGDSIMRILLNDMWFAARALRRRPLFASLVIATLALGIGGNVAVFSVVDSVLLRPLPYPDPERLVIVWENDRLRGTDEEAVSAPDFRDFTEMNRSFAALAARARLDRTLGALAEPVRVSSARVSAGYFSLLGVRPILGRVFLAEEQEPGKDGVVVLTEGLWRARFGADPRVIGERVILDGEPRSVVGVVPAAARMPGLRDELFEPLAFGTNDQFRGRHNLRVVARLEPEATVRSAQADMSGVMKRLEELYPDDNLGRGALVRSLQDEVVGDSRPALLLLFGAVGLLLLMACASVANLILTRGLGRERELAIRTSLGAGPLRLFRQLLTESVLLAALGGAAGALLATWLVRLVRALGPELPRLDQASVDGRALGFALAASLASALVFGSLPALRAARRRPQAGLSEGGRSSGSARSQGTRKALAAFELVAAVVLVAGAGLLVRSFWKLQQVDPGFDPRGLLLARVSLSGPGYVFPKGWPVHDWPAESAFTEALTARLRANPGVQAVAFAHQGPTDPGWTTGVTIDGRPAPAPGEQDEASFRPVSAGYFQALGIPLAKGREFSRFDSAGRPLVAVVNEAFAARHFPGAEPLGQRIVVARAPREIVGVVPNERFSGLEAGPATAMYLPLAQNPQPALVVIARGAGSPLDLVPALRDAVRGIDPTLALFEVEAAEAALATSMEARRFTLLLLGTFAAVALALAAVGIYGVVSFAVTDRTREMGLRMALGAEPRHVFRMVVRQGLGLSLAAIAAGTVLALFLGRVMERLLFGVEARDPVTFAVVPAILLVAAFLASAVPARRATRVDPTTALRAE